MGRAARDGLCARNAAEEGGEDGDAGKGRAGALRHEGVAVRVRPTGWSRIQPYCFETACSMATWQSAVWAATRMRVAWLRPTP